MLELKYGRFIMIIEKQNTNYWQNELIKDLTLEGITDKNFFDFMKGKITTKS